ncbi:P-loop containing nucleoside triphosphate hydrolase protein [Zopfochytrium polystomum]|nr:P-loop containing nucleoside triphosphate hydrolase protein [Zopfochytrium polystomum]
MEERPRKLVTVALVGDGGCGKRSLLRALADSCPDSCRIDESSAYAWVIADGQTDILKFCCEGSYNQLRVFFLSSSTVVLICFTVDCPASLENVVEKWMPEVGYLCPPRHVILVCCRKDLREDAATLADLAQYHETPITISEGITTAERIGAYRYVECSSVTGEGVKELLEHAARASRIPLEQRPRLANRERERQRRPDRRRCIVL